MRKFNITVNGKQYNVEVEEIGVTSQPAAVAAPAVAAPTAPTAPAVTAPNGTQVVAPMPGLVIGFKVDNGATVAKDQPIMVLEAMKMENDIVAPCSGKVTFVAQKGANVDTGAVLAVIA